MRWALLGPSDRRAAGGPLVSGRQQRAVLEVLLVRANRPCSVDRLIDELWPEEPPKTARNSIQRFVADVRRALGDDRDRLVTTADGYVLRIDPGDLDLDIVRAERAEAAALVDDRDEAAALLRRALTRFGDLDEATALTPAGRSAVGEHIELWIQIVEERMQAELDAGAGEALVDELLGLVRRHPYRERLTAHLMTAMARSGQRVAALRAYDTLRNRLVEDVGIEPSSSIQRLQLRILEGELDGGRGSVKPAAMARGVTPGGADSGGIERPAPDAARTDIVGRSGMLARLEENEDDHRLITLVGTGGVGKTTVAIERAHQHRRGGGDARIVLLADVRNATMMLETVAAEVGVVVDTDDVAQLRQTIGRQIAGLPALVVIDNAEHLVDAVAELVHVVLGFDGPARLLVTSRERLGVAQEHIVPIEPLALPASDDEAPDSPAVQLFARRGAAAGTHQAAELTNDPDVVAICRAVDGLPLGIELAAARLAISTPSQIAERIGRSLSEIGRSRRVERQRSMRALLEWSWDLLDDDESSLLAALSAFAGWPIEAIEFLRPNDGIEVLARLAAKSLVRVERSGVEVRYSMLETIRRFCTERVSATDAEVNRSHQADWVLAHARRFTQAESAAVAEAQASLGAETANVLVALDWLERHGCQRDALDLMARAGGAFAHSGPVVEGIARCRRAADSLESPCPLHGVVHSDTIDRDRKGFLLSSLAGLAYSAGELATSYDARRRSTDLLAKDPFDWIIDGPGQFAAGVSILSPDGAGFALLREIEPMLASTASPELNQAQFRVFWAETLMMHRRYEEAAAVYEQVAAMTPQPGRALLLSEVGRLTALTLLGRHDDACALAENVRSDSTTDPWHYAIDVAVAIAIGVVDRSAAAARLAAVLGPAAEQELTGRTNDVRVAAAVVAWHAGDVDECVRLLSRGLPRMPVFLCLLVEYADGRPYRQLEESGWRTRWLDTLTACFQTQFEERDGWITQRADGVELRSQLHELLAG